MKKIQDEVQILLTNASYLRDDDKKLTSAYWRYELVKQNIDWQEISAKDLLIMYYKNQLTDAQTITRLRRQLQMKYPELRGEKYNARMANQEKVKEDLGYNVN